MSRKIGARAFFLTAIVAALAVSGAVFALVLERRAVALGIACGSGIALACGLMWLVGALATFEKPLSRFLRATVGLAPVRMAVAVGGVCALGAFASASVDLVALGCSFAAAHILLQLIEADCFMRLAAASSKYPEARPVRFGGFRLF